MAQQGGLARQARRVAGEAAVAPDHAVAGHDDGDRVGAVGRAHGTHRRGPADALRDGRLVRLSTLSLPGDSAQPLWLVYPLALRDWPPLNALRDWLKAELALSDAVLKRLSSRPPLRLDGAAAEPADGKRPRARSS